MWLLLSPLGSGCFIATEKPRHWEVAASLVTGKPRHWEVAASLATGKPRLWKWRLLSPLEVAADAEPTWLHDEQEDSIDETDRR